MVLATVVTALAVYQLTLIAVAYGKLRPPFLDGGVAGRAHRTVGDSIVAIAFLVATMCVSFYGFEAEDDSSLHVVARLGPPGRAGAQDRVVRWWHGSAACCADASRPRSSRRSDRGAAELEAAAAIGGSSRVAKERAEAREERLEAREERLEGR